ncbi:alpha-E domain-containing protein [Nitratireductor aquimarinus]|uniref:alpha-E domain-containing protein n=1 Tax=Alphaproteobacteria TaxID=28211 RepID=UPI0019D329BC|nr:MULTISPECIES: alpha-E domain-containing protein [Alphaproteobacteria]MBY6021100.1 alpha-E domain-containing protein [Nitratireductor sp. DP7N14-4]MBN7756314.1 alpha-E domain-containing protein [Nitratireductor aquimarinus]MBN8245218.1 alpha-E domain-containing protein [Nitratireductor aquimarinus]MBY5999073.1 alpha-E domain-containing protein [Tritonibacter mobilis]MBY6133603.1 alpha-E domain-containing protein [Nitratireductor aquimarinus]
MLLGRSANGLYWMARYIERAENMARLADTGLRLALTQSNAASDEWASVLTSAGVRDLFEETNDNFDTATVTNFLLRDTDNPSSVLSSIDTARMNARMVRTALTRETWESVNEAWMALHRMLRHRVDEPDLPAVLDAVKRETALIRGAFQGTMLRNEVFDFAQIGTLIERADNTARILDVKYYVLLPSAAWVGSSLDNSQWQTILRSVSALRSYRWTYDGDFNSSKIADFLILNRRMPRSLAFSYRGICDSLDYLADEYGERQPCHELAHARLTRLKSADIADVFDDGLHEFLSDFIRDNAALGNQIAADFRFY